MGVLLMVLSVAGVIAAGILFALSLGLKLRWLRNGVLGAVAIWFTLYFISLLSVSALSRDETLKVREAKAFCGFYLDCHLHAAVENVSIKTDGIEGPEQIEVRLRLFNDARRATLRFSGLRASVLFEDGTVVSPETGNGTESRLAPGDFSFLDLRFVSPAKPGRVKLLLTEGNAADRVIETFLIGDEDSLFHGRKYFDLGGTFPPAPGLTSTGPNKEQIIR